MTEITNLPELPKGWTWIKIKDMCDVRGRVGWRGYKKTDLRSEGPYVIGATHLSDDFKLDLSSPVFISKEKYFESPEIMANQGDIIIAQRGSLGKLGIVDFDIGEATINPCVLLMKNIKILNTFLLYLLASPKYNNILIEGNKSTTTPMITQKFIKNFIVPIPPFNEQKRIVSKIEELFTKLDVGVKEFKSIKKKLDVYRKSVLKNAFFNKLIKLETSWKDYEIKDISEKIQYGLTSNSSMGYGGSKYLRITDIQNRKVDWKSVPFAKKTEELDKYYLKDGDLVFARTGATVGKSFLIKDCPKNAVFASYLIRITPDLTKILPELLWYYFQSPMYWEQISKKKLGIGQPNVNGQILSKLPIHLPKSIESQKQLFQEIDSHFSAIGNLEETVNNVLIKQEHLRKSILKRGFEGQLVPQDPSDEPAEILLEGIKNEKGKYEQMRLT